MLRKLPPTREPFRGTKTVSCRTSAGPGRASWPAGSGAPYHFHKPAVNLLFYGRKQWSVLPPADAV